MYIYNSGYCPYCKERKLLHRQCVNHILHAILTALTAGFWAFIWMTICLMNCWEKWHCTICGTKIETDFFGKPKDGEKRW